MDEDRNQHLGFMPYLAATWATCLYFTTPAAWLLIISFMFDKYLLLPIILYLCYIWYGAGSKAAAGLTWRPYLRRWGLWRALARYFPVRLIRDGPELDPDQKYIFGMHPHGVLCVSAWATYASDGAGFSEKFPGIDMRVATLRWNFNTPIAREVMLLHGFVDADAATLRKVLRKPGRAVLLAVGGAEEALLARPGTNDLILNKRKGFVKIALQTGAALVPTFTFGETDTVTVVDTAELPWARGVQRACKALGGFTLPFVYGSGLFGLRFGLLPHRVPITCVVGQPIAVPHYTGDLRSVEGQRLVDEHHRKYVDALKALYDAHKEQHAPARRRSLDIVQ